MQDVSRRGLFGFFSGVGAAVVTAPLSAAARQAPVTFTGSNAEGVSLSGPGAMTHNLLLRHFGQDIYSSWFKALEFESFDGKVVTFSFPVKFVRNWVQQHYKNALFACSRAEFNNAERIDLVYRQSTYVPSIGRMSREQQR